MMTGFVICVYFFCFSHLPNLTVPFHCSPTVFLFLLPSFLIFSMPRLAVVPSQPPVQGILDCFFRGKLAGA